MSRLNFNNDCFGRSVVCTSTTKRYYTSYSYGSNDTLKWALYRDVHKGEDINECFISMLKKYRKCSDNYNRFLFINGLINEEREILARVLNKNEFDCFLKILSKVKVVDEFDEFRRNLIKPKLVKVDYIKKKSELLVNNILKEVELIKEVRIYE